MKKVYETPNRRYLFSISR